MKFGVREICDVVLKAKAAQKIGNKVFYKNEFLHKQNLQKYILQVQVFLT